MFLVRLYVSGTFAVDDNLALFSSGVVFVVSKDFHFSTGALWLVWSTGRMQHR
jgi:hypothetical protein